MDRKEFFDKQACAWDENQAPYRPVPEEFLAKMGIGRGEDVLEIGCGTGSLLEPLARRIAPGRLFALDFSGEMLSKAAVKPLSSPLVVIYAGAQDTPLPDYSVDRVLMVNAFSQFPEPQLVISEIARVLRRGGRLDIKYFFSMEEVNFHHSSKPVLRGLGIPNDKTLYEWLASAGFISTVGKREDGFHLTARLTRHVT